VLGTCTVMVFDGRVTHSSTAEVGPGDALALIGTTVHVLPAGYGYDLESKRALLPGGEPAPERRTR
jgi:cyanophycinase